jgi:coproporphyrinogen III oxidase-like Fe-S oxidoreductase
MRRTRAQALRVSSRGGARSAKGLGSRTRRLRVTLAQSVVRWLGSDDGRRGGSEMKQMSTVLFDEVSRALAGDRPLSPKQIDFKNPYFTQPKDAERDGEVNLRQSVAGASIQHVYVHVPFCATHCTYCHYPTITNGHSHAAQETFVRQVEEELDGPIRSVVDCSNVKTVHIGGGTPNCLSEANLDRLIRRLNETFRPSQELAVELYPSVDDLDEAKFQMMRAAGVTRVSLGVQTFDDRVNEQNQRLHQRRDDVMTLIRHAQNYCENVSLDLLYGQRGQSQEVLADDCVIAADLGVNSIYLYQTRQLMHKAGVDLMSGLNLFLCHFASNGYEIVAFDQVIKRRNSDGFCEHRSGRSLSENLLGVGPGAVSEIDAYIFRNRDPGAYARHGSGLADGAIVKRSGRTLRAEYLNRALRHYNAPGLNGTLTSAYKDRFGTDLVDDFDVELQTLSNLDLIRYDGEKVEVTELGMHFTQHINYLLLGHYK